MAVSLPGLCKGLLYWTVIGVCATLGVLFMLIPVLPLMYISPFYFRKTSDYFITFFLIFVTAMTELVYGIRVIVSGDKITSEGDNLIIMNHRTRLDWMFFWCGLWRNSYTSLESQKISLKYPLKFIPGLGWATQFAAFIFMRRNFEEDKKVINNMLDYYRRVDKHVNIVYFPEGTDKSDHGTRQSHKFADKNNLCRYEFVLHPRVNGFSYVAQKMQQRGNFGSLYDVSVAYHHTIPQDELAILKGDFPQEVHFHIKRIPTNELPESETELQDFCRERWRLKEDQLREFYTGEWRSFVDPASSDWTDTCAISRKISQAVSLLYFVPFSIVTMYYIYTVTSVMIYTILSVLLLVVASVLFGGLDTMQAKIS